MLTLMKGDKGVDSSKVIADDNLLANIRNHNIGIIDGLFRQTWHAGGFIFLFPVDNLEHIMDEAEALRMLRNRIK